MRHPYDAVMALIVFLAVVILAAITVAFVIVFSF
jgi:hypothetical protein